MIVDLLLFTLIAVCICLVLSGFQKPERVYQYPFLTGGMFLIFIVPQAISLINNSKATSNPESAIQRVLIMSCLCIIASWLGYIIPLPKSWLPTSFLPVNEKRLKWIAMFYVIIGIIFAWFVNQHLGTGIQRFSGRATGIVTVLIFFMRGFLNLGFPIVMIAAIKKPSFINSILAIISLIIPVYNAFFLGRRTGIGLLFISIALAFYFVKRKFIPRWLIIVSIIIGMFSIISIRDYRQILANNDWGRLTQINPVENLQTFISNENTVLELRNAAFLIDFTVEHGQYGWGGYYWDRIVFSFVPAQFLGTNFKQSLQLGNQPDTEQLSDAYNYAIPTGSTMTGIGEAFIQFDYFGCLMFAFSAFICKWLWYRALLLNNGIEQSIYISVILSGTVGTVVTGHSYFLVSCISILIFTLPIRWLSINKVHQQPSYFFK